MRIEIIDHDFQGTPHAIASFLVFGDEGPVLVETGPGSTLPNVRRRLAEHGVGPGEIRHVLVTHIHLDHAGAAGWWAQQGATVYVHPVGAPHLIDPGKLLASATRIYGDQMDSLWGEILPAPADRVVAVGDGATIEAGDLRFTALETPGHASHHHVFRLGDVAFTGDAAGIRIPDADLLELPAPPPEFDLEIWKETLARLRRQELTTIYRTHFGVSTAVPAELDRFEALLEETAAYVRGLLDAGLERDAMVANYEAWVQQRARADGADEATLRILEVPNPRYMTVDGIVRYWRKRAERGLD